ncbi:MAG: hypothetical protein KIT25_11640 [Enhydrobacter sp.]|nr:MAG: hypothetical protein KIT25_11640 [Enhydrobacter sp.]
MKAFAPLTVAALLLCGACDKPMTGGEKGAIAGSALGTGIGLVTGGSFGTVVGAGLIGGAAGFLAGTALDKSSK